jgi:putative spermidine/putrescine transport system substrate-binding protein
MSDDHRTAAPSVSDSGRVIDRRRFLGVLGGAAALGLGSLAACSSEGSGSQNPPATSGGPASTGSAAAPTTSAAATSATGGASGSSAIPSSSVIASSGATRGPYGGPVPRKIGGTMTMISGGNTGVVADLRKKYIVDVMREYYDVEVTIVGDLDYARIEAAIKTNTVDFDLIDTDIFFGAKAAKQGWLEPVDYAVVQKDELVDGSTTQYWTVFGVGAHHMAWNTAGKLGENGPSTWAEFYDTTKFPGSRALRSGALQTLPGAAMGDGVAPENLYPLDLDRAFKSLDRVKDLVVKWVDDGQTMENLAVAGEADMFNLYTNRCVTLKQANKHVDFRMTQATREDGGWIIPAASKHKAAAQAVMAVILNTPEFNQAFAEALLIGTTNVEGMAAVKADTRALLTTSPENLKLLAPCDNEWWADNEDAATKRMTEWLLG